MSDVLQSVLRTKLEAVVNNCLTGSTSATNVLNVALSVWTLNEPNILVVDRVGNLPYLEYYTSPNSIVCFISDIGVFAISSNMRWITLDGRLLRNDQDLLGLAWSWGCNNVGQLGTNTTTSTSSPVSVVGGLIDWCQVSAGATHSVAVRTSGSAWSWGSNYLGALGLNINGGVRSSPVSVVGGFTNWCQISAGRYFTAAVRSSGSAWAWGRGGYGALGDNTITTRSSPVSVVGGFSDWCQISAGLRHTAAVRSSGSAWTWGDNTCGPLGDNTTIPRSSPVSVVGGFTDWCQISANGRTQPGENSTVAVRSSGSAWAWGFNTFGQLGDFTSTPRSSPVSVVGLFDDWCQVSISAVHTVAIRAGGSVWAWGLNIGGLLGNNSTITRSSPVSVVGGFTNWCQVSAGSYHTVAVRRTGSAWAWGSNPCGQLGDCTTTDRSSPVSVVGGFSDWCQVSAGLSHSLGIRSIC